MMEPSQPCLRWKSLSVSSTATNHEGDNSPELLEGVGAGDIGVQDKERGVILSENVTGESERTGCSSVSLRTSTVWSGGQRDAAPRLSRTRTCSERLGLNREVDGDAVLLLSLLEDGNHDLGAVVDGKNDVLNTGLNVSLRATAIGLHRTHLNESLDLVKAGS